MAGKHRNVAQRTKRVAMVTAATATATAMTVCAAAPQPIPRPEQHYLRVVEQPVDLSASVSPFGPPGSLPDITGGAGRVAYDGLQGFIESYERALAGINIGGGLGLNIEDLLSQIPTAFLDDILGAIPINLVSVLSPILNEVLGGVVGGIATPLLVQLLSLLNLTDSQGNITLSAILGLVGLDLSDPLNLAALNIPGLNIITPGEPFLLLKMLSGLDLGWTPGTANAVADAINGTPYLEVGLGGLLEAVLDLADDIPLAGDVLDLLDPILNPVLAVLDGFDLMDLRIPIVIGYGFGAMAAGSAYQQALDDLTNQPRVQNGGPLFGSLTLLPMILANNVGRANGGMLARFYPFFDLLGIDVITPDVQATNVGVGIPLLDTGIELGAANLVPIKIDAGVQYQPYSDFAAWPNPFSLFNNLLAGTIGASYILRGVELDSALDSILEEVGDTVGDVLAGGGALDINIYLTLATRTLPLLEPLYLAGDVLNAVSFGTLGTVAYRLANALAPALTSLVNLGYTDVERQADGTYTRTLEDAGVATPFMSFPDVNWGRAINDVFNSLVNGFHKEFFSGRPSAAPPNVLENLGKLLQTLTGGLGLGGLTAGLQKGVDDLVAGLTGQAGRQAANAQRTLAAAAGDLPDPDAKLVTVTVDTDGEVPTGKHAGDPGAPLATDSGVPPRHAAPEEEQPVEGPATEEPVLEEPVVEEPVVQEPVVEEPPAEEPAAEEPAAEADVPAEAELNPEAEPDPEPTITKRPTVKNPLDNIVRDITKTLNPPKKSDNADPGGNPEAQPDNKSEAKKSDAGDSDDNKSDDKKADKDAA